MVHLERHRKTLIPRVSQREAATRAGISRQYWEEIVAGKKRRHGATYPIEPPYETIMSMAKAVGAEHQVGQILGMIPPDQPEPAHRLTVVLRDERERRLVEAILQQVRDSEAAAEGCHSLGELRAG